MNSKRGGPGNRVGAGRAIGWASLLALAVFCVSVFVPGAVFSQEKKYEGVTLNLITDELPWYQGLTAQLPEFEAMTGAKVNIVGVPYEDLHEKILLELVGGTGAFDLVLPDGAWAAEIMATGYVIPIDDLVAELKADPEYDFDDLIPGGLKFGQWKDHWYGIPSTLHTKEWLVLRQDVLDAEGLQPPTTWEEFNQLAERFTGYEGKAGKIDYGTAGSGQRDDPIIMEWMSRLLDMGGAINDKGMGGLWDENWEPTFNGAIGVEAAELTTMQLNEYGPPGPSGVSWDDVSRLFNEGRVLMITNWDVFFPDFENPEVSKVAGKIGYYPLPSKPGTTKSGLLATRPYYISAKSKNQEAAKEFIAWATSKKVDKGNVMKGGPSAIRFSTLTDPDVQARYPQMVNAPKIYSVVVPEPLIPEWAEIKEHIGLALSRILQGEMEAKPALDKAAVQVRKIFKRAGYTK